MKLNKFAAAAAMAAGLGSAAFGIGSGLAQADPGPNIPGPNIPGPNIPGPNIPGPNLPGLPGQGPGQGVPGLPAGCVGPGANCFGPGTPLPPGQNGFPPPGHYNDPVRYGLPATWLYNGQDLPLVFNPDVGQWGVQTQTGFQVYTPVGGAGGQAGGGGSVG